MDLKKLADPFPASDVEWRVQSAGKKGDRVWARVLAYITNRAIMERLDEVCGPENWKNEYRYEQGGAVLCGISVRVEGEWVTKWDGAENTDIEAVKGGLSNAMKRCGVQWGIGRYLYELEEGYANVHENGAHYQAKKDGKYDAFKWDPPALPAWALPGGSGKPNAAKQPAKREGSGEQRQRPTENTTPTRAASTTPTSAPTDQMIADEDRIYDGKRLGDYTEPELAALNLKAKQKGAKDWQKWIMSVRTKMTLGQIPRPVPSDDESVQRMQASEDAFQNELPAMTK